VTAMAIGKGMVFFDLKGEKFVKNLRLMGEIWC
jgi:hypothetical protein